MRRSAIVALSACLAVAGCGGGDDNETTASGTTAGSGGEPQTLTISAWDTGTGTDPLDTAVEQFEQANPGVTVEVRKTAFPQYDQALRRELSAGDPPDVARAITGYGGPATVRSLGDNGLLADLAGAPWIEEIPEADRFAVQDGDQTFALPVDATAIGAFYEPAAFEEAGVEAPETFADVLAVCERVAGEDAVAFAMGANETSAMPVFVAFALAASTAYAENPDFSAQRLAGDVTFAGSEGWQQAMRQFEQMRDAGCFDEDAVGISQEAASQDLVTGRALMAVAPTATLPLFAAGNPDAELAMLPFPGNDDPALVRVPAGAATGLVVPAEAGNPELAKRFVDFYAEHRGEYAEVDGSIPAIPAGGDATVPPWAQALAPFLSEGRTSEIPDAQWLDPEVRTAFATGLVEILLGQKSGDDVLKAMDAAWTADGA